MNIYYCITETSIKTLETFPWLKENYSLGRKGTADDHEITRLLENPHYPQIVKCLKRINDFGFTSGEIGETLLTCNDIMSFPRILAELDLFIHLYKKMGSNVKPIRRVQNQKSPDISVKYNDFEVLIEVYSPMDFYGYQAFSKLVTQSIKNLSLPFGFDIFINSKSKNRYYVYDFPDFKQVYKWIDTFQKQVTIWLEIAKIGEIFKINTPAPSVEIIIKFEKKEINPEVRTVSFGEPTRSTDTKLYFEISDPTRFAKTEWGNKIKDKLQKQQAGEQRGKVIRILAINFSFSDTSDISFFNLEKYHKNLTNDIKYLASNIEPYPPYDIVLPCELGFECGFVKPVNLSKCNDSFINEFLSEVHLANPLNISVAPDKEVNEILKSMSLLSLF